MNGSNSDALLRVSHLSVAFPVRRDLLGRVVSSVLAVDDVSFHLKRGETLGLVGESGCGKTSAARAVVLLNRPAAGAIFFEGRNLLDLTPKELRQTRRRMQMIHQDPAANLDPRMTVKEIVGEPFAIHGLARGADRDERVAALLETVGLSRSHMNRYPHQFSGGQSQRIGIARALALDPVLVVCDEPTSALDVSVRAQVLNLLTELQSHRDLTYLFIAHDLGVVDHVSDRIAVMYLGKIVETGTPSQIRTNSAHPYTRALMSAMPVADPVKARKATRIILTGDLPSPASPPTGCSFHTRCWLYQQLDQPARCREEVPTLSSVEPAHAAACHFHQAMPTPEAVAE